MNVIRRLDDALRDIPEHPALLAGLGRKQRRVTFRALNRRVNVAVAKLRATGLRPGSRVLLAVPVSLETYVAMLAVLKAGMVVMFIDPGHRPSRIAGILRQYPPAALVGTRAIVYLSRVFPELRKIPVRFVVNGRAHGAMPLCEGDRDIEDPGVTPRAADDAALLSFTSGSTGEPKALIRTHGFLKEQLDILEPVARLRPDDIDFVAMPMFVLFNLANGVTSVIPACDLKHPGRVRPSAIVRQLEATDATRIVASPALLERVADHCLQRRRKLAKLRFIATGGGPVGPTLPRRLQTVAPRATIRSVYGSTEAEPIAAIDATQVSIVDRGRTREGAGLLVGKPVRGCAVRVINSEPGRELTECTREAFANRCVPGGHIGEIVVSGRHVLSGYADPARNAEAKIVVENTVWHRTGDAGYFDASGRLWLVGRCAAAIQDYRGTVHPFQVEYAVNAVRGVRRAALLEKEGERVLALEVSDREFQTNCAQAARCIAAFEIDRIVTLSRIPVDRRHNAKVDYPALHRILDGRMRRIQMRVLDSIVTAYGLCRRFVTTIGRNLVPGGSGTLGRSRD